MSQTTRRASPLSPDERRAMILDAAIPLLSRCGSEVTTKQIADAAGVAEGTLFRVFPDKATLLQAALEQFLAPGKLSDELANIDLVAPVEVRCREVLIAIRDRMSGVFGMLAATGSEPPHGQLHDHEALLVSVARVIEGHDHPLRIEPLRAAALLRSLAFSLAIQDAHSHSSTDIDDLLDLYLNGALAPQPLKG